MGEIVVSFCIPTYNRENMVGELVEEILKYPGNDIEIIVCDNASTDNTCGLIKEIKKRDNRVCLIENETNIGPVPNWYKALKGGNGKWLFQVMDRDWIRSDLIPDLLQTLQLFDKFGAGFAVAGEIVDDKGYYILEAGIEGVKEFALRASHPTGAIFNRLKWNEFSSQDEYWNGNYTVYPHGYCFAYLASKYKSGYISSDICDKAHYNLRKATTVSRFYVESDGSRTENPNAWYLPENRYKLLLDATEHIELFIDNREDIQAFIISSFGKTFWNVTTENWILAHDHLTRQRYNCDNFETNYLQIMANGFDCIVNYRQYLENSGYEWVDKPFMKRLLVEEAKQINNLYGLVLNIEYDNQLN